MKEHDELDGCTVDGCFEEAVRCGKCNTHRHQHTHHRLVTIEFARNCYMFWKECDCGHRILNGAPNSDTENLADVIEEEVYGFINKQNDHD